jgi:hypothetical protein
MTFRSSRFSLRRGANATPPRAKGGWGAGGNADEGCLESVGQVGSQTHPDLRGGIEVDKDHHGRVSHDPHRRQQI